MMVLNDTALSRIESKELGRLVRGRRIALDWSIERLAIEMRRSRRLIHIIESGSRPVGDRTLAQLARIFPDLEETATNL